MSEMPAVCNQEVICVLGMHRSGTSVLTRILNLIGLHLGPDHAVTTEPAAYNAKGHWEHKEITIICESLLKRHGGRWDYPPLFPGGWETAAAINDLRHRAQRLIENQFADIPLWGWKDPRTCLTLSFWQQLVPNMRYVICVRNPVDVALSLEHRDRFSVEKSLYLWLTYVSNALKQTDGKQRVVIFYEDLVDDGLRELRRLAEFVGNPERAKLLDVQKAVLRFIEKELRHYRTSLTETTIGSRIDLYARTLYMAQRISVSLERKDSNVPRRLDNQICEALETLSQYSEYDAGLATQLTELAEALHSQSQDVEDMVRALSVRLIKLQTRLPRVQDKFGRRLLTRYKHTKSYLLPIYREFGRVFVKPT